MSRYGSASVVRTFALGDGFRDEMADLLPAQVIDALDWHGTCDSVVSELAAAEAAGRIGPVESAHARAAIGAAAKAWVTSAMVESLAGLGFAVQVADGPVSAVRAERGAEVVGVEIVEGGAFALDVAGIEDGSCQELVEQMIDELELQGVASQVTLHAHNDPRGGQLLRRVHARTRNGQRRGRGNRVGT